MTVTPAVLVRRARLADVPTIVAMASQDDLRTAGTEDDPHHPAYAEAFAHIDAEPDNAVFVAEVGGRIVGTFQRTFVRHLLRRGYLACHVESVFVDVDARSTGVGTAMMRFAIDEARARGCLRIQLTSQKVRTRAHAFYERLGFVATHEGMKLWLRSTTPST